MKKICILFMVAIPLFTSCTKEDDADSLMEIRLIAWNQLSEKDKSTLTKSWKHALVTETFYNDKEVYAVVFNTTYDELLGPIIVYIDKSTKEVLGRAKRL